MGKTNKVFAGKDAVARKILQSQGWSEGQGLGKSNQGIPEALRPHLKFDTSGMGHDPAKEFTDHWWSNAYNETSRKITISVEDAEDPKKEETSVELAIAKPKAVQKYSGFVKSATLQGGQLVETSAATPKPVPCAAVSVVSDEDLFRACKGLTGHKGARHGITMKAKLTRVEEMERDLIDKMKKKREAKRLVKV
jgi:hypothetical protein